MFLQSSIHLNGQFSITRSRRPRCHGVVASVCLLMALGGNPTTTGLLAAQQVTSSPNDDTLPPVRSIPDTLQPITGTEVKCVAGKAKVYDCENVDLLAFLPASVIGGDTAKYIKSPDGIGIIRVSDMWGWTDAATGREFVVIGRVDGAAFVEVTDPIRPRYLGKLPLHAGAKPNTYRSVKVYKHYAFVVEDGGGPHGMQVFDLDQLLGVKGRPVLFEETAHYDGVGEVHTIAVDTTTGFIYLNRGDKHCGGTVEMIDARDPLHPVFAGCLPLGAHDLQCAVYRGPDQRYRGREICLLCGSGGVGGESIGRFGIVDVTDKRQPTIIASTKFPTVIGTHQGWLSEDHRYFFLGDEIDEMNMHFMTRTMVVDVNKLDDPVIAKEFFGTTRATDHNMYVRGRYLYQGNYVAGLRVLDISNPLNPKEVGYFDTTPGGPNIGIADQVPGARGSYGAWGNYPYFKNGVVAINSISEGLFLVRFKPEKATQRHATPQRAIP